MANVLQTSLWVTLLCKACSGTGIEWRERLRRDVEGDLLEVRVSTVHTCEVCTGTGKQ